MNRNPYKNIIGIEIKTWAQHLQFMQFASLIGQPLISNK
jgi:hypothetical protein